MESLQSIFVSYELPPVPRIPFQFKNRNGIDLVGSFYPSNGFEKEDRHYCVIYLHGNIGSQQEGRFLPPLLSFRGISVFCFDFSGSGNSGGEFVTLGYNEQWDVVDTIEFLSKQVHIKDFVLWGRSMGAACAVLAASNHNLIRGIIVDSAYSSLSSLFTSIAQQTPLPSIIKPMAVWWIKHEVQQRAGFDCNLVSPSKAAAKTTNVPLFLGHATDDDFVPYSHGVKIYEKYACADKEMMSMTGGHNGQRDDGWIYKCIRFILRVFNLKFQYFEVTPRSSTVEHVSSFAELMKIEKDKEQSAAKQ